MNGFKKLGENIKYYREEKGISIEVLAKLCKIPIDKLCQIEAGEIVYRLSTLEKIAFALEIDLPELLNF